MHTRIDLSILSLASFIIGLVFAMTWSSADHAYVRVQSDLVSQILPLDKTADYTIYSSKGHVEIEIKNARARVVSASCNNKICVKHGWLNKFKPIAACVPSEISAQLSSTTSSTQFNAISF